MEIYIPALETSLFNLVVVCCNHYASGGFSTEGIALAAVIYNCPSEGKFLTAN